MTYARVSEVARRYALAACCVIGPFLLAYVAFNLAVKTLVPAKTAELQFTYQPAKPRSKPVAPPASQESHPDKPVASANKVEEPAPPDPAIYLLGLHVAGRYTYAAASGFLYLISVAAFVFGVVVAVNRLGFLPFILAAAALGILAYVMSTSAWMPTPYDLARPLLIDRLLNAADEFPTLLPLGSRKTGDTVTWLVSVNTFVALVPVAMILLALCGLSIRPKAEPAAGTAAAAQQGVAPLEDLKSRLYGIRYALGFGSAILVTAVLASKTLLEWPLKLVLDSQAAALKPIADALTFELGATGTIALFAAFAPAVAAWTLDVACYRKTRHPALDAVVAPAKPAAPEPRKDDDLIFAPLSAVTGMIAVLAPVLASPFVDGLKSILGAIPVK